MRHRSPTIALPAMAALVVAGTMLACGPGARPSDGPLELTVYAAASLRGAVEALTAAYPEVARGISLTVSAGASSALRAQIEQGAPADVFLSADTTNPAALVEAGLTAGDATVIAGNQLAIIVPAGNPAGIARAADLGRPGLKIIAAGDAVPITTYADELVANLAALEGVPPGFASVYAANIVSREDDVTAVVAKIELGEGDAAIVYRSDALASDVAAAIDIPAEADVVASYAGIVIGSSADPDEARAFLDWMRGTAAQAILATFGFSPPPPPPPPT